MEVGITHFLNSFSIDDVSIYCSSRYLFTLDTDYVRQLPDYWLITSRLRPHRFHEFSLYFTICRFHDICRLIFDDYFDIILFQWPPQVPSPLTDMQMPNFTIIIFLHRGCAAFDIDVSRAFTVRARVLKTHAVRPPRIGWLRLDSISGQLSTTVLDAHYWHLPLRYSLLWRMYQCLISGNDEEMRWRAFSLVSFITCLQATTMSVTSFAIKAHFATILRCHNALSFSPQHAYGVEEERYDYYYFAIHAICMFLILYL